MFFLVLMESGESLNRIPAESAVSPLCGKEGGQAVAFEWIEVGKRVGLR
jgi:hypothetical protein